MPHDDGFDDYGDPHDVGIGVVAVLVVLAVALVIWLQVWA